jgi:LCP family protein required for cell wall assembly
MPESKVRRTWPQRLTLFAVIVSAIACFATAGVLASGNWVLSQRKLTQIGTPTVGGQNPTEAAGVKVPGGTTPLSPVAVGATTTTELTDLAEPDAANFLVVGADNNDCLGGGTATGEQRDDIGQRSDTIMVWRVNPVTNQLAVLSFPRDLYVPIAGGRKNRINTAYDRDNPDRLVETIFREFGVPVDHYIQVDFCAFKELVGAVGGVAVPFTYPARDKAAGLDIPNVGCTTLDGDMALAYVRSRHYRYEDPPGSGVWKQDPTSDFGRIARQQDFLRRVVTKVINDGLYSPKVATALIETNSKYLVTDNELTPRRMLEFGNTLRRLDPSTITTYRIESSSETLSNGDKIERPRIGGDNMQAILAVFRGEAQLTGAPDQVFQSTTTLPSATTTSTTDVETSAPSSATSSTTLPEVVAEENVLGIVPDRNVICD